MGSLKDLIVRLWLVPATADYGEQFAIGPTLYSLAIESFGFEGDSE